MASHTDTDSKTTLGLRDRAETVWRARHRDLDVTPPEDTAQLIHELEIHQIELELQNEELLQAKHALEESRHQLSNVYDSLPVGYFTIDQHTTVVQLNLTMATMLGVERERLLGEPVTRFVPQYSQANFFLAQRAAESGIPWSGELMLRKIDGTQFPVAMQMAVATAPGSARSWRCAVADVATRQAVERASRANEVLRASEDRYHVLAEQLVDGIFLTDAAGRYVDANYAACDLLGYTLVELKALTFRDVLIPDELARLPEQFRRLSSGEIVRNEWRFKRKHGAVFVGELAGRQLSDGRLQMVVRDVTERKEAEQAQHRLHQLAMLHVTKANVDEVLGAVVETGIAIAHADFGNIQLLDDVSGNLHIVAYRGFPHWWLDYWQNVSKSHGTCGTALQRRQRVIVEDIESSDIFGEIDLEMQRKAGVRSIQSTPLVARSGRCIGMLSTHFTRPWRPDEQTLLLLDLLAREAADIILSARDETELQRRAALLDLADNSIFVRDAEGRISYWNAGAEAYYGWTSDEALGQLSETLLHTQFPESREQVLDVVARTGHWEGELVQTCRDGRRIIVDSRWAVQRNGNGHGLRILEINNDITKRKEAETALRESEQRLQSYIDQAGDAIYVLDSESGRILNANSRAAQMLGYTQEELLQLSAADLGWVHVQTAIDEFHTLAKQDVVEVDGTHRRKDGSTFPVEIRLTSLAPALPHRMLSIVRDVSERKRVEEERAEEARRKDEFLAFLGHELRNPLAAIYTAIQVVSRGASTSQRSKMEEIIRQQTVMMRRLVDDLLELERITHGHIALNPDRVELAECLQRAVDAVQAATSARRQELFLRLPPEPVLFMADGVRLDQIVGNLLTNASKYTEAGGRIELSGAKEGEVVVIRCKDNGQGILPEYQQKIFDPFVRERRTKLGYGDASIGLGLALVKQLIELHGGTISVESGGAGLGSEFTVRLPLVAPPSSQVRFEPPTPAASPGRRVVVVVEDNPSVGTTLKAAIEQAGHVVHLFGDGPSTLAAASALKPEAFVMDIGLPGMDGYELAAKLKQQPETAGALRVAVSGLKKWERADGADGNFDHYFTKPVDVPSLLALFDKYVSR